MHDWIDIGSAPAEEDCAQVGQSDYYRRARRECLVYRELIRRTLGIEPKGAQLVVKTNPHDFGDYLSVACNYDPEIPEAVDYAFRCESDGPANWDQIATWQLEAGERGHACPPG